MIGERFPAVMAAAQRGEEWAFAALWRDANPALLRYLKLIAPGAAQDVASDTWLQVTRGLKVFSGDESGWRGWLFTVARRRAVDESRRRARRPSVPLDLSGLESEPATWTADAADAAVDNLATERAIAAVAGLPPLQAEAILLRVVAGLDYESIGQILGRRPGAVRVATHRGLRRLSMEFSGEPVTR